MNDDDHVDNERKVRTRNNHNSITNILDGIVLEAYEKIMLGPLNTKVHMNIGFNFLGVFKVTSFHKLDQMKIVE